MKECTNFVTHDDVIAALAGGHKAFRVVALYDADGRIGGIVYAHERLTGRVAALRIEALGALADTTDDADAAATMRGLLAMYRADQQSDQSDRRTRRAS